MGGSILSHDHFQGGAHEFPMMHATEVSQFSVPGFDQVSGTVLQWPLSVLRLRSHDRAQLLDAARRLSSPGASGPMSLWALSRTRPTA